jgi:hypothetical protein
MGRDGSLDGSRARKASPPALRAAQEQQSRACEFALAMVPHLCSEVI